MDFMNKINEKLSEMNDISGKYENYQKKSHSEIIYHKPINSEQAKVAKSLKKGNSKLLILGTAVFAGVTVLSFMSEGDMGVNILLLLITIFLGFVTVKSLCSSVEVMTGIAVYKDCDIRHGRNNVSTYYVSVKPDNEENVIYTHIQISAGEYARVSEGTPIMVVKFGIDPQACIYSK